jgi:RimJ/RimL family protein N-acetyltransferase
MHLHLWKPGERKKGLGTAFVKQTLPFYFNNLQLKNLFCEPNAHNTAPNKTLEKVGFRFIKQHITTPGWLNFEQPVNRWVISRGNWLIS